MIQTRFKLWPLLAFGGGALVLRALLKDDSEESQAVPLAMSQGQIPTIGPMDSAKQEKAFYIITLLESGKIRFDALATRDCKRDWSYGAMQAFIGNGNLERLLDMYLAEPGANPEFVQTLAELRHQYGGFRAEGLCTNETFKDVLVRAGREDQAMRVAQAKYFHEYFLHDAYRYAQEIGLQLPASYVILGNFFINSGNPFKESRREGNKDMILSARSADEVEWMSRFVDIHAEDRRQAYTREGLSPQIIQYTAIDRRDKLKDLIQNNPMLDKPFTFRGTTV